MSSRSRSCLRCGSLTDYLLPMKNIASSLLLILFALPFAGIGTFMGYLSMRMIYLSFEMSGWNSVPVVLEEVILDSHQGKSSTSYSLKARYHYDVGGKTYTGNTVGLSSGSDNVGHFHEDKYQILDGYRQRGESFLAKVHPSDPNRSILFPEVRVPLFIFYMIFAVVFGSVGYGLIAASVFSGRTESESSKLRTEFPNQPWMHRKDWKEKKLVYSARTTMLVSVILALVVNSMALPILLIIPEEVFVKGHYGMLFLLLFNALGAGFLVFAYRATAVWKKFGSSLFELTTLPALPGRSLEGALIVSDALREQASTVQGTLKCVSAFTSGSGKNRRTSTTELYSMVKDFPLVRIPQGSGAQVKFDIPAQCQTSSPLASNPRISWNLEFKAEVPGVNYTSNFEIPVFQA